MNHLQDVTVVLVTYNSAHCIQGLLPLLEHCPFVVVSDNGSDDDTVAQVEQWVPHATVLSHGQNLGFGAANNRALAKVTTPFALLLNPDCHLDVQQLRLLLDRAKDFPEAAVLAPQILKSNGQADVNYRWPNLLWRSKGAQADGPVCVGFVCGAVMLFRLEAFAPIGFFDEDFFLYYEDDDLCWRLFQQKKPIVVIPDITATHFNRGSVKGKSPWRSEYLRGYHHAQSKLIFSAKHIGAKHAHNAHRRLVLLTAISLPLRLLAFSPRLIARMWGRMMGLMAWKP